MAREFDELRPSRGAPGTSAGPSYGDYTRRRVKDPSQDTFRQRFAPFSSDPVGDYIEQQKLLGPGTPVRPGTRERFLDPTKVISQLAPETTGRGYAPPQGLQLPAGGQDQIGAGAGALPPPPVLDYIQRMLEAQRRAQGIIPGRALGGKVDPNQPYIVGEGGKPEVFVPDQPGTVVAAGELPPGFTRDPDGTIRGPAPAQPQGLPPGFTRGEDGLIRGPQAAAPAPPLAGVPLSQDPAEQAREVAALRLSRGQKPPEGRAEESSFLKNQAAGFNQFLQDAGGKLQEPQNALPAALGGPLAPGIAVMRGGAALARGLSEGGFQGVDQAATGRMVQGAIGPGSTRLSLMAETKAPEEAITRMANLARTSGPEDLKALAQLRKVIPADKRAEVQAALVNKLGESADTGEFAAESFIKNYGQVSDRAKNILFGEAGPNSILNFGKGGSGSLRNHLDNIAEVTQRMGQVRGPSNTAIGLMAGAAALTPLGHVGGPLAVLGTVLPARTVARALTSPATAATVAAWSRAYERVLRSGGNAAIVSYNMATRNLNNTLGSDINPIDALGGARGKPVE